jgi:hypothetical protein
VLETLRARDDDVAAELVRRLAGIGKAIEASDYRIANIRAGYVYVISAIGAFGPNIVKIGTTRRLEPMDRVRELGDASVPFRYDVHAMLFSAGAVTLENELHKTFNDRRVNLVSERREFFFSAQPRSAPCCWRRTADCRSSVRTRRRPSISKASATGLYIARTLRTIPDVRSRFRIGSPDSTR